MGGVGLGVRGKGLGKVGIHLVPLLEQYTYKVFATVALLASNFYICILFTLFSFNHSFRLAA